LGNGGAGTGGNPGNPGNTGTTLPAQNCIVVTGGSSYPVTVGSGGFVTIAWNPQ
jgi:hypothetical protein